MKHYLLIFGLLFLLISCSSKLNSDASKMNALELLNYFETPDYRKLPVKEQLKGLALFNGKSNKDKIAALSKKLPKLHIGVPPNDDYVFNNNGTVILTSFNFEGEAHLKWSSDKEKIVIRCDENFDCHRTWVPEIQEWSNPVISSTGIKQAYYRVNFKLKSAYAEPGQDEITVIFEKPYDKLKSP